jgi:hypothetical protein
MDLAGLTRLAKRYGVDDVAQIMFEYTEVLWPKLKTLEDWDSFSRTITGPALSSKLENLLLEPASVIRFALEFRVNSILPAIYYLLARIDPNGTSGDPSASQIRWNLLDSDTILQVLRARLGSNRVRSSYCGRKPVS